MEMNSYRIPRIDAALNYFTEKEVLILQAALTEFEDSDRWDEFSFQTTQHLAKAFRGHERG
jgi:hypothetical protein